VEDSKGSKHLITQKLHLYRTK